jgi:hypothetical protein
VFLPAPVEVSAGAPAIDAAVFDEHQRVLGPITFTSRRLAPTITGALPASWAPITGSRRPTTITGSRSAASVLTQRRSRLG